MKLWRSSNKDESSSSNNIKYYHSSIDINNICRNFISNFISNSNIYHSSSSNNYHSSSSNNYLSSTVTCSAEAATSSS